jgi:hypothetical protein
MCSGKSSKICKGCNKEFTMFRSQIVHRTFCSLKCKKQYNTIINTCKYCNKDFRVTNAHKNQVYCSKKCEVGIRQIGKNKRKTVYNCETCNKKCIAYRVARFCSNICRLKWFSTHFIGNKSPQWLGGQMNYYGPN